jgi:Fe-S-cluster containining protein
VNKEHTLNLLRNLEDRARKEAAGHRKYLLRLKEKHPRDLDAVFKRLHDEVFETIDCLTCARCCRVRSPRIKERDINRLAKHFNTSPKGFANQYLTADDEGDFHFKTSPCPFIGEDNLCQVYDECPDDCSEYPYTDSRNMRGMLVTLRNNIPVCPAVYEIVEKLKGVYPL